MGTELTKPTDPFHGAQVSAPTAITSSTPVDPFEYRVLPAYRYNREEKRWTNAPPHAVVPQSAIQPHPFTVVTFNVWFDSFAQSERAIGLLECVRTSVTPNGAVLPDVIAFQEVTEPFFAHLRDCEWLRKAGYQLSDIGTQPPAPATATATAAPASDQPKQSSASTPPDGPVSFAPHCRYGVVLAVRSDHRVREFRVFHQIGRSYMGRQLLAAEIDITNGPDAKSALVGTIHLESSDGNAPLRQSQLHNSMLAFEKWKPATAATSTAAAPATLPVAFGLLCGDFNFDAAWENEQKIITSRHANGWCDVWPAVHTKSDECGWTEDETINLMRSHHHNSGAKKPKKQVRFDRVLLYNPNAAVQPSSIKLLGTQALTPPTAAATAAAPMAAATADAIASANTSGSTGSDASDSHACGVWPSDHFGLHAAFTHVQSKK